MRVLKLLSTCLLLSFSVLVPAMSSIDPGDSIILKNDQTKPKPPPVVVIVPPQTKLLWIGAIAGFNVTTNPGLSNTHTLFPNSEYGPAFGLLLSLPMGDYIKGVRPDFFTLRVEVLYSYVSYTNVDEVSVPYTFINKLAYIDVPIALQFTPVKGLNLFGGIDISSLTHNTSTPLNPLLVVDYPAPVQNISVRDGVWGFTFGLDYKIGDLSFGGRLIYDSPFNNDTPQQHAVIGEFTASFSLPIIVGRFQGAGEE
jgi:hypothetical protein